MKELNELLANVKVLQIAGPGNTRVCGMTFDSRAVKPGSLFVAVKGTLQDGHLFIGSAVQSGDRKSVV